jgi:hypothetical protein
METHEKVNGMVIVGLAEDIKLISAEGKEEHIAAKIDTGATKSSIDTKLATKLKLGPIIKSKVVKSAHGNQLRPVIEAEIEIAGKKMKSEFTLADRSHMRYQVLIGVNILENRFLVDPSRK